MIISTIAPINLPLRCIFRECICDMSKSTLSSIGCNFRRNSRGRLLNKDSSVGDKNAGIGQFRSSSDTADKRPIGTSMVTPSSDSPGANRYLKAKLIPPVTRWSGNNSAEGNPPNLVKASTVNTGPYDGLCLKSGNQEYWMKWSNKGLITKFKYLNKESSLKKHRLDH